MPTAEEQAWIEANTKYCERLRARIKPERCQDCDYFLDKKCAGLDNQATVTPPPEQRNGWKEQQTRARRERRAPVRLTAEEIERRARIGRQVRAARQAMGLNQIKFGELWGVIGAVVSQWENGVYTPPDEILEKILAAKPTPVVPEPVSETANLPAEKPEQQILEVEKVDQMTTKPAAKKKREMTLTFWTEQDFALLEKLELQAQRERRTVNQQAMVIIEAAVDGEEAAA